MTRSVLALIPFAMACSEATVDEDLREDALPNVENAAELESTLVGSWEVHSLEMAVLGADGTFLTAPYTVRTGELSAVPYADGSGQLELLLESALSFYDDGSVMAAHQLWSDGDDSATLTIAWSEWEPLSEKVEIDQGDLSTRAFVTALGPDELFLDWDLDEPICEDDLCIFSIEMSRVDDEELDWIDAD